MNKPSFFIQSFRARSAFVACLVVLMTAISGVGLCQDSGGSGDQETIRQAVQETLQAGQRQYESGNYAAAVQTLQVLSGYEEHLTGTQRDLYRDLLKKARSAADQN